MLRSSRPSPQLALLALSAVLLGGLAFAVAVPLGHPSSAAAPIRGAGSSSLEGNLELALAHESLHGLPSGVAHPAMPPPPPPPTVSPGGFEWSNLTPLLSNDPSARAGEAMAWDPGDGYVLMYGGENTGMNIIGDTWSFSNGTWTNLTGFVTGSPPSLLVAGLAFDPSDSEMILFGGENSSSVAQDQTWAYHDRVWTNLTGHTGATPLAELLPAMATDSAASDVLLFGGDSPSTSFWTHTTWAFKTGAWTNLTATAGAPAGQLYYPAAVDDPAVSGVVLYAVYPDGAGIDTATLQFTGGSWHNLSGVASGDSGQMILTGGGFLAPLGAAVFVSSEDWNDTFAMIFGVHTIEYSNQSWTNATSSVAGPPELGALGGVTDLAGESGLITFGGLAAPGISGSTWVLTAPPQVTLGVAHIVTDVGVSDAFNSSVTGGYGTITYQWSFGDGSTSSAAGGGHAYAHAGRFQANLTVTDALGHRVVNSAWVQVDGALAANVSASPTPATAGVPVALIGGWSGGTAPYSFSWSLGDLNGSGASSLAHIYARAGNYSVSFTVTDALAQKATGSITVPVKAAPPSASSSSSTSSVSLTSGTGLYLLIGIALLAVVAAALAVLLARRPRTPPGPPAPYASAPPAASYGQPPAPPPGPPPTG